MVVSLDKMAPDLRVTEDVQFCGRSSVARGRGGGTVRTRRSFWKHGSYTRVIDYPANKGMKLDRDPTGRFETSTG
jgi:hypothetical protein